MQPPGTAGALLPLTPLQVFGGCVKLAHINEPPDKQPYCNSHRQFDLIGAARRSFILKLFRILLKGNAPDIPETISGADTLRNGTLHSLAIALARAVFPQPGGP